MTNLFAKFRRRWPLVVASVLVFTAVGLATLPTPHAASPKGSKGYRAQVTLGSPSEAGGATSSSKKGSSGSSKSTPSTTKASSGSSSGLFGLSKETLGYIALGNSPAVAKAAAASLGGTTSATKLAQQVTFAPNNVGEILVRAKDQNAAKSAAVASAFANALVNAALASQEKTQADNLSRLNHELAALEARIRGLQGHQTQTKGTTGTPTTTVPKKAKTATTTDQNTTDLITQIQLNQAVQQYSVLYHDLLTTQQRDSSKAPLEIVSVKKPVAVAATGSKPIRRLYWAVGGFGLGLLLGLAAAAVLTFLDRSVTDETKAEALFGLPILAYIPEQPKSWGGRRPVVVSHPVSAVAEAYRRLTTGLEQLPTHAVDPVAGVVRPALDGREPDTGSRRADGTRQVLGVVGASRRAGCTTVIANLSAALSEREFDPLVVDANLRRPSLHSVLGVDRVPGAVDGMTPTDAKPSSAVPRVRVIPAGSPAPSPPKDLLKVASALPSWRRSAGVILVDIADLSTTNDAAALAGELDALIVVCARPTTTPRRIHRVLRDLGRSGAPVVGVVLVEVHTGFFRRLVGPKKTRPSRQPKPPRSQKQPRQPKPARHSRRSRKATTAAETPVATTDRNDSVRTGAIDGRPLQDSARIGSVPRDDHDNGAHAVTPEIAGGGTPGISLAGGDPPRAERTVEALPPEA